MKWCHVGISTPTLDPFEEKDFVKAVDLKEVYF